MNLSIVTPYKGGEDILRSCSKKIEELEGLGVEWVIVDGSEKSNVPSKSYLPDFAKYCLVPGIGLYAAMNYGIRNTSSQFYIPMGADDSLDVSGIKSLIESINNRGDKVDIFTGVVKGAVEFYPPYKKKGRFGVVSHLNYVSQHSVGSCINKELHSVFGFYSEQMRVAADSLFLLKACSSIGAERIENCNETFGYYGSDGVSTVNKRLSYSEMAAVSTLVGGGISTVYYLFRSMLGR